MANIGPMIVGLSTLQLIEALSPEPLDHADVSPTKRKLVAAAEQRIGERGVTGLVLEDVARAAGQSNKMAVQYHYTDKAGLIHAIFALRHKRIVARRIQLLDAAIAHGLGDDLAALLETIAIPLAEQVNDAGVHSFARFWLQLMASAEFSETVAAGEMLASSDVTAIVIARMGEVLGVPLAEMHRRLYLFGAVFPLTIVDHDKRRGRGDPAVPLENTLADAVRRVAAAVSTTD